jgi:diguanylate cyclase (GGDEF)-like protein
MRDRIFIAALALAAAAPLHAQQGPDPRALLAQAEQLQDVDDEGALRLVNQALPLLQRPEDRPLRLKALAMQCWSSAEVIEPDAQVRLAQRGIAQAQAAGDEHAHADLRVCRGYAYDAGSHPTEALADYDFGVREGRRLRDARVLATALLLRGEFRYYRGELGGALEDLNESYALYSRLKDESRIRLVLNAVANVYADDRVAQYDRAIDYYRQVLASNQAAGQQTNVATGYYNLGSTLELKGDLAGALGYFRRALELERRLGDEHDVAECQRKIGVVLGKMNRHAEALRWLNDALAYFQRTDEAESIARTRLSRAVALRRVGRAPDALADLDGALAHFRAARNDRFLERVQAERALAFAAVGDWKQAFDARGEQIALQSALATRLREETTSQLRVRFDSERKEQENRALLRENADAARIRSLQTMVIALTLAIIGILAYLTVRHLRTARLMRTMALTDELTRLPNRRHLLSVAAERVNGARQGTGPLSVLALDIDHFKRINDTFGHEVGDRVLHRVAATCRAALRRDDVIGRTGGEEFVVMPGADVTVAAEVAERLRAAVEGVEWSDLDSALRVTVSVGATQWMPGDDDFADVARRADESLYRAKERGRNRIELAGAA